MELKKTIKDIIEKTDTKIELGFDYFIQLLILASVLTFSISTLPNLSIKTVSYLNIFNYFVVFVFSVEYLLRIYTADNKQKYIISFFGIIDLLSVLPFYLATILDLYDPASFDLLFIRVFRLLRLLRIFKLARYSAATRRFHNAFLIAKEEIFLFCFIALLMIYLSAVGIYYFENNAQPENFSSVIHSLWWSVSTLTTVGYGDIYPVTHGGKILTFFILLIGLGLIAVPSGLIATALTKARELEKNDKIK